MRHITRPLVTRIRRASSLPWCVDLPPRFPGPQCYRFDTWPEAYAFAVDFATATWARAGTT